MNLAACLKEREVTQYSNICAMITSPIYYYITSGASYIIFAILHIKKKMSDIWHYQSEIDDRE
jgi:hypothetical protein